MRLRFAPSPTGYLHVGGARTALFNWLYARRHGGTFVLRIEDTDEARNTAEARAAILDGLRWLGLDWDEGPEVGGDRGPYFQSQRTAIYDAYLAKLEAAGRTYTEENGAVRFKFSRTPITIPDLVCGDVNFAATVEPDMTIRRPDGSYIFHFVNVVDDLEMGITHVIRAEDHLSNTWKHIDLFRALGAEPPRYGHIPLILNENGSKMSKRDEGSAVQSYVDEGYIPEAVFNYLCLLGWTSKQGEKLERAAVVQEFDLEAVHSANAKFDLKKCQWFNAQYLRALSPEALLAAAQPFLIKAGLTGLDDDLVARLLQSVKEKVSLLNELPAWLHYFFADTHPFEAGVMDKLKAKPENTAILNDVIARFATLSEWTDASLHQAINDTAAAMNVKPGAVMPLLRFALSGQTKGPGVTTILELMGQERSAKHLAQTMAAM